MGQIAMSNTQAHLTQAHLTQAQFASTGEGGQPGPVAAATAQIIPYPASPRSEPAPTPDHSNMKSAIFKLLLERVQGAAASLFPTLLMIALLLGLWQVACSGPEATFPSPLRIWTESHELIVHPFTGMSADWGGIHVSENSGVGIAGNVLTSLKRVGVGFGMAAIIGIGLGILVGQSVFAYRALDPLFQILRTVPPLAWLPIALAIFKQAGPSTLFLIFITAIWPVILNTAAGVQALPDTYRNVAKVLALNPIQYFFKILLPATVPYMFTGLRIGVGMSWLAIVAAEMVQGGTGVGFFIWDSYNSSLLTDTIVALLWIGMVGFTLDRLVAWLGRIVAKQD
jgi:nitrate/nitrite transport system permease protein